MNAEQVIEKLGLEPLGIEGGYYRETYRAEEMVDTDALPERYVMPKNMSTAIYYMLTQDKFSALHRLPSDEVFHFYLGDPVALLLLNPDGTSEVVKLGNDLFNDQHVQYVVPAGTWQGAILIGEGKWALMGTTVAPGFEFGDFEPADRKKLMEQFPYHSKFIMKLTRE